jgi:hypothetical protein
MSKLKTAALASALLAATLVAGPLQATEISGVDVRAHAPTSVVVQTAGLTIGQVRQRVRGAAAYVCANAVINREVAGDDQGWCAFHAADKAMGRYRAALHRGAYQQAAAPVALAVTL